MRVTLVAIALSSIVACAKPGSDAPIPAAPPDAAYAPAPAHGTPVDLTAKPTVTLDATLTPGQPLLHRVIAPAKSFVGVKVTHTGGEIGMITVSTSEWHGRVMRTGSDSLTCVEPGCAVTVNGLDANDGRPLFVDVEGSVTMTVRVELTSSPSPAPSR